MRRATVLLSLAGSLVGAGALVAACSSSSSSGGSEADSGGAPETAATVDAVIDVVNNPNNCVKPGTASNSLGIGGYCNPNGGQCAKAGPGGSPTICTGDVSSTMNAWFCTLPCPTQCGPGAMCMITPSGSECVPTACAGLFPDASVPGDGGGGDAASGDSGPSDAATGETSMAGDTGGGD